MPDAWRQRLRGIARRAGLERVPDSVILAAVVACLLLVALGVWRWWPRGGPGDEASRLAGPGEVQAAEQPGGAPSAAASRPTTAAAVWVHVVGAVRRPGVYQLAAGARVNAALEAAGGLLGNAALQAVNLARPVQDGEQILVPTKDELAKGGVASAQAAGTHAGSGAAASASGPIDLNSADAALLDTLPGVGPSTAAKIVADRETNGPFGSVDDLGRVAGIGPKKLDALRDLVCVR